MSLSVVRIAVVLTFAFSTGAAQADARDAVLTRAVAAKEMAMDHPEPVRWHEAFERFLEADAMDPLADVKYELGFIASQLRQDDLAVGYYEDAIRLGLSGPGREKAQAYVQQYGPSMARLSLRGKAGTRIRIRGMVRGLLPLERPLVVFPGTTQVDLIEPDHLQMAQRSLLLHPGQLEVLDVEANERAPAVAEFKPKPIAHHHWSQAPRPSTRRAEGWVLGAGLGLMLANGLLLPVSYAKLASKRGQLARACDVPSNTEDGCESAKAGQYHTALALADDIASWRTVRAVNWAGVGVGATAAMVGLLLFYRETTPPTRASHVTVIPVPDSRSLLLNWQGVF